MPRVGLERRGKKRAAVAVAHSILVIGYHVLRDGTIYSALGANYFDERDREAVLRRAVRRIEHLGFKVTLESAACAAVIFRGKPLFWDAECRYRSRIR